MRGSDEARFCFFDAKFGYDESMRQKANTKRSDEMSVGQRRNVDWLLVWIAVAIAVVILAGGFGVMWLTFMMTEEHGIGPRLQPRNNPQPLLEQTDTTDVPSIMPSMVLSEIKTLDGAELREAIAEYVRAGHQPMNYKDARRKLYWVIDRDDEGEVTLIYTRREVPLAVGDFPTPDVMNCEHLWPKSRGTGSSTAEADLHHLRPSDQRVNSARANYPFGSPIEPYEQQGETGWALGEEPDGDVVFIPPPMVRGDIARAMFYFAMRYDMAIDDDEEEDLRAWHDADPVDEDERERHRWIVKFQGNRNLFIDWPDAVQRIEDF